MLIEIPSLTRPCSRSFHFAIDIVAKPSSHGNHARIGGSIVDNNNMHDMIITCVQFVRCSCIFNFCTL